MKIAFFDTKPYDKLYFTEANKAYKFKIKFFENKLNEDTAALAQGYDAVCVFVNDVVDKKVVDILYASNVKLIALRCAGYNNVDFKAAYNKLHVVRVPAYSPYAVAEHAVALMVTLNRKIHKAYNRTRENNFNINGLLGFDMHNKTIGIIGTGKIGQLVAKIAGGYGMKVLAYDAFPSDVEGMTYVDLDTLYKESDIITLHCPLVKETYHMIDREAIAKMQQHVMLINTSRGGLVDTEALIEAVKNKQVGSAGLDVYEEEEEYFFEDFSDAGIEDDVLARLLTFNNVLVTSHQAFFTKEALLNIATTTLGNIDAFNKDKFLENEICYQCGKNEDCNHFKENKCF